MGNAFGKTEKKKSGRAKPTLTEQDRAILDLKLARDGLKRYQQRTEKESTTLLTKAKLMYKAGDTKKAVYLMKVRKLKASKIDDLNAQLMTIERMVATIEWKTQSVQIFNAMQTANGALKSMQAILPIERVEALMDDVTDSVEYQQEIDEALSGQDIVIEVECRVRALIHQTTRQVPITQTAFSSLKIGPSHHANVATDASASVDRSGQ